MLVPECTPKEQVLDRFLGLATRAQVCFFCFYSIEEGIQPGNSSP